MIPSITIACVIATIVCLAPAALYLLRITKDPFHPTIFIGGCAFFLITYKTFSTQEQLTSMLDAGDIVYFQVIVIFSMLGYYAGWAWSRNRTHKHGLPEKVYYQYDPSKLLNWGFFFAFTGLTTYALTFHNFTITGYIQDLPQLWIIGLVMILQAVVTDRRLLMIGVIGIAACMIQPINNFYDRGQRGDVIRVGIIAMVPFLAMGRRPSRATVIVTAMILGVTVSTLHLTRGLLAKNEATGRVDALFKLGPAFFKNSDKQLEGGEEWYYGAAAVKTAWVSGRYGCGRVFLVALPLRFLPKEFFPWKYEYYYNHVSFSRVDVPAYTGVHIPWGAAPTGFAESYVEFWIFFPLFWAAVAYIHQRIYARGQVANDLQSHCFLVAFGVGLSYLMAQEFLFGTMNIIYSGVPALLAYRFCRLRQSHSNALPALYTHAQS